MQKVEGSSPFIRLGTESNQASLASDSYPKRAPNDPKRIRAYLVALVGPLSGRYTGVYAERLLDEVDRLVQVRHKVLDSL